jgi:hypothetical protein
MIYRTDQGFWKKINTIPTTNRMAIQINATILFLLLISAQLLAGLLNRNITRSNIDEIRL